MELGMGFFVGLLGGIAVALIAVVLVAVSRKVVVPAKAGATDSAPAGQSPAHRRTTVKYPAVSAGEVYSRAEPSGNTVVVEAVENHERRLAKNVQDVRELLLRLAEVIHSTGDASGKANTAFHSVKGAIDAIAFGSAEDLAEAQRILVVEIDKVLKSNADLHGELDRANKGIAEQRRQIEELRVQARIDGLTLIPNRAAFEERLAEYLGLLERTGLVFTLLLLDIDHFKRVNDEHGHLAGDRVLRGVAAKISASVRANDFAARYGGEEFAVIFPGSPLSDARVVAERVCQDIAKTKFRLDDEIIKMTVSGGLSEAMTGMDAETVVAAADKALYQAKSEGRNRLVTGE